MYIKNFSALILLSVLTPAILFAQNAQIADSLFNLGSKYDSTGINREAERLYGESFRLFRSLKDTAMWFKAGKEYASALVRSSKNERAFELYNMLYKLSHPVNTAYQQGDIQNSMGWAYNRMGKYDKAIVHLNKALPLALESGDEELIGVIYGNIGMYHYRKGNYDESLRYRKKTLPYYKELGSKRRMAILYNNIGLIYKELGLYDQALSNYTRSLEIRKELGSVSLLATIYDNLAVLQKTLGNYDQALIALQKSLEYRKQSGEPRNTAVTLNNIGLIYKSLGQSEKALSYYRESLNVKKAIASPDELATTYRNLANELQSQGDHTRARKYYNLAYNLFREVENPVDISRILVSLSSVEREEKNWDQALQYANRAKVIADSIRNVPLLEEVVSALGGIEYQKQEYRAALAHFKDRYTYSLSLPTSDRIEAMKDLSNTFDKLESDSSVSYALQAIELIEKNRSKAGAAAALRAGYFKQHAPFYKDAAIRLIKYRDNIAGAYRLVESAKARALADELQKAALRIDEKLPEEVRIERNKMVNKINRLYTGLESAVEAPDRDSLHNELRQAELDYAAFQNQLQAEHPQYKVLKSPSPVTLQDAQALLENGTAILEYTLTGNNLLAFLVGPDEIYARRILLENRGDSLKQNIQYFRDGLLANAPKRVLNSYTDPLADLLLNPFELHLEGYSNLIIVPDGVLAHMPFEAINWKGKYLIEDFDIKYTPSITSLNLIRPYTNSGGEPLLAVAGSAFTGEFSLSRLRSSKLNTLPSTLTEVDSIASHFPNPVTLKDRQVNERTIKEHLSSGKHYRYVHLATHGIIDETNPELSGLVLTTENNTEVVSPEDGLLRSSEIYRLNMGSDLVTLSACNSGLGQVVQGEGMLGLQRSFFYAGTSTVVVSLWNVYDRATAVMMNEFYKALLAETDSSTWGNWWNDILRRTGWDTSIPFGEKARAMRRAKLKMIDHPVYNHPVYWAPFIVVGR